MSAIGGIINFSGQHPVPGILKLMAQAMQSRGRDTQTVWQSGEVGFIHKQLFTTQESLLEKQPLVIEETGLALTADARIDNRDELLPLLNCTDISQVTDADLILGAYEKWNEQCVDYLIGDFAFALWDKAEKKLFCARDHLGIKPFYYIKEKENFIFASEVSALFIASGYEKSPNPQEISHYMDAGVISGDATFFTHGKRLLPGHVLILKGSSIQLTRYWFPETIRENKEITFAEARQKFHHLIQEATKVRMRSISAVGCETSGGLDSSTVLAMAKKNEKNHNIMPFARVYGELACDESVYIRSITEQLDLEPQINRSDLLDYADKRSLHSYYERAPDWPGYGCFLDVWGTCEDASRKNIRVILTGQGGDHVAAGNYFMLADYFKTCNLKRLYREHKAYGLNYKIIRKYIIKPLLPKKLENSLRLFLGKPVKTGFSPRDFCFPLSSGRFLSVTKTVELSDLIGRWNQLWMEINPYKTLGGHFDIEFRHPFFDKRVVEFMLSIPPWFKVEGNQMKIILREAMKNEFPEEVLQRQDKAEFSPMVKLQLEQNARIHYIDAVELQKGGIKFKKIIYNSEQNVAKMNGIWKDTCMAEWIMRNCNVSMNKK